MKLALTAAAASLLARPAAAQQISPTDKYAWGENIGFLNFADAGNPPGSEAVFVHPSFLEGFVWGENVGWINLGDGAGPYANTNGLSFGVNRSVSTGELSGYAWGENIGWVNFSGGALATPANPARIDATAQRFRGYAWGENVGWINLDDQDTFVALHCPADFDFNDLLDFFDVNAFLSAYDAQDPAADLAAPFGAFNIFDIQQYVNLYNQGCP